VIVSLNIPESLARYWYEGKEDFPRFFSSAILLIALLILIFQANLLGFKEALARLINIPSKGLWFLVPLSIILIINQLFQHIFVPQKKSKLLMNLNMIQAYTGFGISVLLIFLLKDDKYIGILWGRVLAGTVIGIIMIWYLRTYFHFDFSFKHAKYMFHYALPLIPYALSGPILSYFDRIMINSYRGASDAGLYSLAYNIGMLLTIFIHAFTTAWTPDFYKDMKEENYTKLDADILKMFKIILFFALMLMLLGPDLGRLLADKKFHPSLNLVPVIVFGYIFMGLWQFWGRNFGYSYKTGWISIIGISGGLINILLNAWLIPLYGYPAGAYTTVVSFMYMAACGWLVTRFVLKKHVTYLLWIVLEIIPVLILFGACFYLLKVSDTSYIAELGIKTVFLFLYVIWLLRDDILLRIKTLKERE
jgi:O-antigen/teichoic acid export membrane protein